MQTHLCKQIVVNTGILSKSCQNTSTLNLKPLKYCKNQVLVKEYRHITLKKFFVLTKVHDPLIIN